MAKMTLGSPSYFGLEKRDDGYIRTIIYKWIIKIYDVTTIILKIIDFDVNCQQGR